MSLVFSLEQKKDGMALFDVTLHLSFFISCGLIIFQIYFYVGDVPCSPWCMCTWPQAYPGWFVFKRNDLIMSFSLRPTPSLPSILSQAKTIFVFQR